MKMWFLNAWKVGRALQKPKKHDCRFIDAEGSDERSLPLIFLSNMNVVVTPSYIKLGEEGRVLHVID